MVPYLMLKEPCPGVGIGCAGNYRLENLQPLNKLYHIY